MDIEITEKKELPNIKKYLVISLAVIFAFFAIRYLWVLGQADFTIEGNSIVVSEVNRGQFTVSVRGSGVLVPDNIQWLSSTVEGNVERRIVKAGNIVKKGDLLVVLSNPQLQQELAEVKWDLEAKEEELKASKVAQELALLEQKAILLNAKLNYEKSSVEYEMQTEVLTLSDGNVSQLEYRRTELETKQFKQRWQIAQERLAKMEENLEAQNNARIAIFNKTKKKVERIQQQVDNLNIIATMDSVVIEMPLEIGQRVMVGANVAKLAQQGSLIAELQVPEIQIRDVAVGQNVLIDTRNSKFNGRISRVDPAVINGNVQIDVAFDTQLPDDARPDLSVDGDIIITEIADTLFVDRPLFVQSKSQSSIYKLSDDGQFAQRVEVKVGYGSVNQIQILEGLKIGDKIITSNPTRFETYQKFRIN